MPNPILGVDTYEDGGLIDEALLFAQGVSFMCVRLNDISGGHHMDEKFWDQWAQAARMPVRILFFVYNPWVDGQANFDWLVAHAPADVHAVLLDVEVEKPDYPPSVYAAEVDRFHDLCRARWHGVAIYTGFGSMPLLSSWPVDANYWWAQYPNSLYPVGEQRWSWDRLRSELQAFSGPLNADKVPGRLIMWQCSGDRLIMDGCEKAMDVNVWMGSWESLLNFAGSNGVPAPDPEPSSDITLSTHDGVVYHRIRRFGTDVFVHVIDTRSVRVFVTPRPGLRKVSDEVAKYGAQIGVNGGGWPNDQVAAGRVSNEIWVSDGQTITANALDDRPYINVTQSGMVTVIPNDGLVADRFNAWGFDRLLVINGEFNTRISDRVTKDARTFCGVRPDGQLVVCVASGDDRQQRGLTFPECAAVLIEFGVINGGNNDGGSSSTVVNTYFPSGVLNEPSDGVEARVINHVLFFASGGGSPDPDPDPDPEPPPGQGGSMITFKSDNSRSLRSAHSVAAGVLRTIPAGATCVVAEVWTAPSDVFQAGVKIQKAGDRWARVTKITLANNTYDVVDGWTAVEHLGVAQGVLTSSADPEPDPVPGFTEFTITLAGHKPFSGLAEKE